MAQPAMPTPSNTLANMDASAAEPMLLLHLHTLSATNDGAKPPLFISPDTPAGQCMHSIQHTFCYFHRNNWQSQHSCQTAVPHNCQDNSHIPWHSLHPAQLLSSQNPATYQFTAPQTYWSNPDSLWPCPLLSSHCTVPLSPASQDPNCMQLDFTSICTTIDEH